MGNVKGSIGGSKRVTAVYTGDTSKFHKFTISDENFVGTIYVNKEHGIPGEVDVDLITPQIDKHLWKVRVNDLLEKSRPGSKSEANLKKVFHQYGKSYKREAVEK